MIDLFAERMASVLPDRLREPLSAVWRRRRGGAGGYSALGEDLALRRLVAQLGLAPGTVIDIAACDGVTKSNTLALYEAGWRGVAVEGDPERFARLARAYARLPDVALMRLWVTPENVCGLLGAAGVEAEPAILNLDIDSYDYFVLDALLASYRPRIVCAEINEKIPPPLRFTVVYDPTHVWQLDHFYGQSIAKLYELCEKHAYSLVDLHYNNAFLVPSELGLPDTPPAEAYRRGYLDRPDRLEVFPWNADMEALHELDVAGQLAFVHGKFAAYEGRYELDA